MTILDTTRRTAIGYCRVSTVAQGTLGLSMDAQKELIHAYCKANSLDLAEICHDVLSGSRADNRRGLQTALGLVCKSKGVLIVYSLSRLARSTMDCITIVDRIEKCGGDLASISEKLDTSSPMGKFSFRLFSSLAELERDQVSERTKMVHDYLKRSNRRQSRFAPYGWDFDGKLLKVNPSEQIIVGAIISRRREGGGLRVIANELNAAGAMTKYGKKWDARRIHDVVKRSKRECHQNSV